MQKELAIALTLDSGRRKGNTILNPKNKSLQFLTKGIRPSKVNESIDSNVGQNSQVAVMKLQRFEKMARSMKREMEKKSSKDIALKCNKKNESLDQSPTKDSQLSLIQQSYNAYDSINPTQSPDVSISKHNQNTSSLSLLPTIHKAHFNTSQESITMSMDNQSFSQKPSQKELKANFNYYGKNVLNLLYSSEKAKKAKINPDASEEEIYNRKIQNKVYRKNTRKFLSRLSIDSGKKLPPLPGIHKNSGLTNNKRASSQLTNYKEPSLSNKRESKIKISSKGNINFTDPSQLIANTTSSIDIIGLKNISPRKLSQNLQMGSRNNGIISKALYLKSHSVLPSLRKKKKSFADEVEEFPTENLDTKETMGQNLSQQTIDSGSLRNSNYSIQILGSEHSHQSYSQMKESRIKGLKKKTPNEIIAMQNEMRNDLNNLEKSIDEWQYQSEIKSSLSKMKILENSQFQKKEIDLYNLMNSKIEQNKIKQKEYESSTKENDKTYKKIMELLQSQKIDVHEINELTDDAEKKRIEGMVGKKKYYHKDQIITEQIQKEKNPGFVQLRQLNEEIDLAEMRNKDIRIMESVSTPSTDLRIQSNFKKNLEERNHNFISLVQTQTKKKIQQLKEDSEEKINMLKQEKKKLEELVFSVKSNRNLIKTLFDSLSTSDYTKVKLILLEHPKMVHHLFPLKQTPIHIACKKGDLEMVEILLNYSANPTSLDIFNRNCVEIAAEHGHKDLVNYFEDLFNQDQARWEEIKTLNSYKQQDEVKLSSRGKILEIAESNLSDKEAKKK